VAPSFFAAALFFPAVAVFFFTLPFFTVVADFTMKFTPPQALHLHLFFQKSLE
jgi:hypothetical protein